MYVWRSCLGQFHLNYLFTLVIFLLYHMYALRIHTNCICFLLFFFQKSSTYIHIGTTITVSQRRQHVSLEFTLLQLLVVMMLVVYVTYIYIYTAPSLSFHDKELRNILFPSFFLFFLIHKSSLNESTDRVYKCVLGKILVRNKHSVRQCT